MKKVKKIKHVVLDAYEQEIEEALERGEYVPVANLEESKKMLKAAAGAYLEQQRSKRITLRVKNRDLIKVKAKAKETGIPYQRIISALIHQYVIGKVRLAI